jgi:hypothetical protein
MVVGPDVLPSLQVLLPGGYIPVPTTHTGPHHGVLPLAVGLSMAPAEGQEAAGNAPVRPTHNLNAIVWLSVPLTRARRFTLAGQLGVAHLAHYTEKITRPGKMCEITGRLHRQHEYPWPRQR